MAEPDLTVTAVLVPVTGVGFWMLKRGLDKLRVLLRSTTWPKAPVTMMHVGTRHHSHTTVQSEAIHGHEVAYYERVDNGPFYTRAVRKDFYPVLTYTFEVQGEQVRGVNVDAWNAGGYAGTDSRLVERTHREWADSKPQVAYDPKHPARHFLGMAQFPLALTLLEVIGGLFLASGLAVLLGDVCALAGIEEPTFGQARRSWFVLVAPILGLLLLFLGSSKPRPSSPSGP